MIDPTTEELVALHLAERGREIVEAGEGDQPELPTADIIGALGTGGTLSERIELLSTISAMKDEGLLEERVGHVSGLDGPRNVYSLTTAGRRLANDVRERIQGESVTVARGEEFVDVPLSEMDEQLPELTLVETLASLDEDGRVYLSKDGPRDGFVDRETEQEILRSHLAAVDGGGFRTVLVEGESGIGKTSLLEHVLSDADDRGFELLTGQGHAESDRPYRPFQEVLADHRSGAPGRLFDADEVGTLDDLDDRRRSLFYDVGEFLSELASSQPLAVFIDDLHAADRASLALFEHLAGTLEEESILLVGAFRPEEVAPDHPLGPLLADDCLADAHIDLDSFDQSATGALVQRTLEDRAVPREFVETIHGRTGGNPLFVEASLDHMRDQQVIDPRTGHYPDRSDVSVPERVQTTIERRLDSLDEEVRTTLERAAVVGDTVPFHVLAAISDRPEPVLRRDADLLADLGIWEHVPDADVLEFATDVARDVVLDWIDEEDRRELHARIAAVLRERHDDPNASADAIARHYDWAGDVERAIEFYGRAGDHAAGVYAHETAVDAYERALALAREHDRDGDVLDLLREIGDVHLNAGANEDAERYYRYVRDRTDDPETVREIAANRALIRSDRGEYDAAIDLVDRSLGDWDESTVSPEVCRLLYRKTWPLIQTGRLEEARSLTETHLEMAGELDDGELRASGLNLLGILRKFQGELEAAADAHRTAIEIAQDDESPTQLELFAGLNNLASINRDLGDHESAVELYEQSREYARKMDNRIREMTPVSNVGYLRWKRGEWDRALDLFGTCIETCRSFDHRSTLAFALMARGKLHIDRGEFDVARRDLDESVETGEAIGYNYVISGAHVGLAALEHFEGNLDAALEHVETGLETVEDIDMKRPLAGAYGQRGAIYLSLDRVDEAVATYESGVEAANARDATEHLVSNRCGLAVASLRAGRDDRALEEAEAAREAAIESSYPLLSVEAHLALGRIHRERDTLDAADEAVGTALEAARRLGVVVHECQALAERGRVHRARGDTGSARDDFEAALALAEETGASLHERRCRDERDRLGSNDGG